MLPRLGGMVPSSWLNARDMARSDDKLPRDSGMVPVRLFLNSLSILRRVSLLPSSEGRSPRRWLDWRSKATRPVHELRLAGSFTGEAVVAEVKRMEVAQAAEARRDGPAEGVGAQVQKPQGRKVTNRRGEHAGEPARG